MKERARLSGLFPRVRNEPMSKKLQELLKEFEQNAALTALLQRRRALEGRSQYNLQALEGIDDMNVNLVPWARMGRAVEANSARVAQRVAAGGRLQRGSGFNGGDRRGRDKRVDDERLGIQSRHTAGKRPSESESPIKVEGGSEPESPSQRKPHNTAVGIRGHRRWH